ncbi:phage portal protein [Qipengyuania sp.]|uniref:phage portal protein n=1 Tax=Qipengyuania sp. TaxID=2004515 RepID=UPI0035146310
MGFLSRAMGAMGIASAVAEERSLENPQVSLSDTDAMLGLLGLLDRNGALPRVSIEAALAVPAVWGITNFLPRTLAALPFHTFEAGENGERVNDPRAQLLSFASNAETSSYAWRKYHWHQVFTIGRGLSWIERAGDRAVAIWSMDASKTQVIRRNGRKFYKYGDREYPAKDVIDTPFLLKPDGLGSYSPIEKCNLAISLAIAMGDFAGGFFAGGGVPPYALEGPLPTGRDGLQRARDDIQRAIDLAKKEGRAFFGLPPGHKLNPIGTDPSKGQMVEARLFQIQEVARIWQMPPVFVQDLSKGTFTNTEQQDLQLVKHLVGQWAKDFEDEVTLKLYGQRPRRRAKHNLDGLQRGAFKDRIEALARAILTGQLMPDEARALENRPPAAGGDRLYVQQATVPLEEAGVVPAPPEPKDEEDGDDAGTETEK